jgi:hypothetical protein
VTLILLIIETKIKHPTGMQKHKINYLFCTMLLIGLISTGSSIAQNATYEFWPETDIWFRLSPSWRLSAFVPVTKYYESKYRDLNLILQADYAWGHTKYAFYTKMVDQNKMQKVKSWLARGGYMGGWSLGENKGSYSEDMLFAEIHKRTPLLGNYLLSMRLRTDFRWVGEEPDYSYRIRYRIMLEKEYSFEKSSYVPYINVEPFYDSRYLKISRVRVIGGATASWGPRLALEGNLTYQYDETYSATNLYAVNIIVHLFFETARSRLATQMN